MRDRQTDRQQTDGRQATDAATETEGSYTVYEPNKLHRLTERDNRLAHYFVLFRSRKLLLGYLATSGAKSDLIFLLSDPDFL